MDAINNFSGEYKFLDNVFIPSSLGEDDFLISYEGIKYKCVESAYCAMRIKDPDMRVMFSPMSGLVARNKIRTYSEMCASILDDEFPSKRQRYLKDLLIQKYKNEELKALLYQTENRELIYENSFEDTILGVCNGIGDNLLGRLTMEVRSEIIKRERAKESLFYSIGYANLSAPELNKMLDSYGISFIIDIRHDRSSHNCYFYEEKIQQTINSLSKRYLYKGDIFGGIPISDDPLCFDENGLVNYEYFWDEEKSVKLNNLVEWAKEKQIKVCFLTAEQEPSDSHRSRLIGKHLLDMGIDMIHILGNGGFSLQSEIPKSEIPYVSAKNYWQYSKEGVDCWDKIYGLFNDRINSKTPFTIKQMEAIKELAASIR